MTDTWEGDVAYGVEYTVGPEGDFAVALLVTIEDVDVRIHLDAPKAYRLALDLWRAACMTNGERA